KGTQSAKLCADLGYTRVSTGDIIRGEIRQGTLLGKSVAQYQAKGLLVPDDIVCEMVFVNLAHLDERGLIFDGFPRTLLQAQRLDRFFVEHDIRAHIILVDVAFDAIESRIVNRVSCPSCNSVYNRNVDSVLPGTPCPRCGTTVVVRQDDTVEVLKNRYDIYCREIAPILAFYSDRVQTISGTQTPEVVYRQIRELMNRVTTGDKIHKT
ncbi:hypothetical protein EBR57_06940, partial [bacterium]|nr:hypothetical protein [bacterium]